MLLFFFSLACGPQTVEDCVDWVDACGGCVNRCTLEWQVNENAQTCDIACGDHPGCELVDGECAVAPRE